MADRPGLRQPEGRSVAGRPAWLIVLVALGFACAMPLSARVTPLSGAGEALRLGPIGEALQAQLATGDPVLAEFYRARAWRPMWVRGWILRPEARQVMSVVAAAAEDGLDPQDYAPSRLAKALAAARSGDPADLARAEISLSEAVSRFALDLHTPKPGAEMIYADPAVAPSWPDRRTILAYLGAARSPGAALAEVGRMNPYYEQLKAALRSWRAQGGDEATAVEIRVNLERARALPARLPQRYILVDAAAQTLWFYQDGHPVASMPVVVGKQSEPTPIMAAVVRYAVVRPYWNVPPDLVRNSIAPQVLRKGVGHLASQDLEALSDWSDEAEVLKPEQVDWAAVAAGRRLLRVRQRPGPGNMMGKIKFVFPNELGVYLHDTPLRRFFEEDLRTESAGCVRLSDAPSLARLLLAEKAAQMDEPGAPEMRIALAQPVPVYIVYFTVAPSADGLAFRPDVYRRDAALAASLERSGPV